MQSSRIIFTERRNVCSPLRPDETASDGSAKRCTAVDESANEEDIEDTSDVSGDDDGYIVNYDPMILSPTQVSWISACKCLALNMEQFATDGVGKAFVSGYGSPDGLGYFNVHERGSGKVFRRYLEQRADTERPQGYWSV